MKKGVIVSGYFNPLHKGHIEYLKLSKKLKKRYMKALDLFMNKEEIK